MKSKSNKKIIMFRNSFFLKFKKTELNDIKDYVYSKKMFFLSITQQKMREIMLSNHSNKIFEANDLIFKIIKLIFSLIQK